MRKYAPGPVLAGILLAAVVTAAAPVRAQVYVKHDATGANDGTSWMDAFTSLQTALDSVSAPAEVWVAAGTYRPTPSTDRTATFQLASGVALYGGFSGTESSLAERDLSLVTTLSGDIGIVDDSSDNCYHVVTGSGADSTAILDGFTITGGNADGAGEHAWGGGIVNDSGSPTLRNLYFFDNSAGNGGAIFNRENANAVITNVLCMNNSATSGGAISNIIGAAPVFTSITVVDNTATIGGGGISNASSSPTIVNALIWGNQATDGPQVRSPGPADPLISYSYIEGCGGSGAGWDVEIGIDGGGNIDGDPVWMLLTDTDYRLTNLSPTFNAGDNTAPRLASTDIAGNPRIIDGTVDMGAVEFVCSPGPEVYVDIDAAGAGNGSDWANAFTSVREALMTVCDAADEVWIAEGIYTPTAGTRRDVRFVVRSGLDVYGGFDGTEMSRGERDPLAHPTTLSGEVGAPGNTDNTSNVLFTLLPDTATVIDGITVSGSYDSSGVIIDSALLRNLVITDNHDPGNLSTGGGLTITGDASVTDVTVSDNSSEDTGGIFVLGPAQAAFTRVSVLANTGGTTGGVFVRNADGTSFEDASFVDNTGDWAGGLYCWSTDGVDIDGADFTGNTSGYEGGGMRMYRSDGVIVRNATFDANQSSSTGAGVRMQNCHGVVFLNPVFRNNSTPARGGALAAGIQNTTPFTASQVDVIGGLFLGNSADAGGAIYNRWSEVRIVNSTFYGNHADTTGGAIETDFRASTGERLTIANSILWGNTAVTGSQVKNHDYSEPGALVSYSLIQGSGGSGAPWDTLIGDDLGNNIDTDPFFVDPGSGDLHLSLLSPAIDAGDSTVSGLPMNDIDGNPRVAGVNIDMGAYEYQAATAVVDPARPRVGGSDIQAVYPNPFNPSLTIAFRLDRERRVTLTVFDAAGRRVTTLFDGVKSGGEHRIEWDAGGAVASGVYFLRIESGAWRATRKVVLVK